MLPSPGCELSTILLHELPLILVMLSTLRALDYGSENNIEACI